MPQAKAHRAGGDADGHVLAAGHGHRLLKQGAALSLGRGGVCKCAWMGVCTFRGAGHSVLSVLRRQRLALQMPALSWIQIVACTA